MATSHEFEQSKDRCNLPEYEHSLLAVERIALDLPAVCMAVKHIVRDFLVVCMAVEHIELV
jgi:hypothetical protein